jgi:hypothetical protein
VLIAVYRTSPEQAFRVLQWRSQETNIKVRALAKQLIREISTRAPMSPAVQRQFDHLLLTVHERFAAEEHR